MTRERCEARLRAGDKLHLQITPAGRLWWFEGPLEQVPDPVALRALDDGCATAREAGDSLFGWAGNSQTWGGGISEMFLSWEDWQLLTAEEQEQVLRDADEAWDRQGPAFRFDRLRTELLEECRLGREMLARKLIEPAAVRPALQALQIEMLKLRAWRDAGYRADSA